jgi:hypothetical protein
LAVAVGRAVMVVAWENPGEPCCPLGGGRGKGRHRGRLGPPGRCPRTPPPHHGPSVGYTTTWKDLADPAPVVLSKDRCRPPAVQGG